MPFDNPVELLTAFLCALLALFFLTRSLPRLSTGFTDRFQPLAPPLLAYLQRPGLLASVGMLLFFCLCGRFLRAHRQLVGGAGLTDPLRRFSADEHHGDGGVAAHPYRGSQH